MVAAQAGHLGRSTRRLRREDSPDDPPGRLGSAWRQDSAHDAPRQRSGLNLRSEQWREGTSSGWPVRISRAVGRGGHPKGRSVAEEPRSGLTAAHEPCAEVNRDPSAARASPDPSGAGGGARGESRRSRQPFERPDRAHTCSSVPTCSGLPVRGTGVSASESAVLYWCFSVRIGCLVLVFQRSRISGGCEG